MVHLLLILVLGLLMNEQVSSPSSTEHTIDHAAREQGHRALSLSSFVSACFLFVSPLACRLGRPREISFSGLLPRQPVEFIGRRRGLTPSQTLTRPTRKKLLCLLVGRSPFAYVRFEHFTVASPTDCRVASSREDFGASSIASGTYSTVSSERYLPVVTISYYLSPYKFSTN